MKEKKKKEPVPKRKPGDLQRESEEAHLEFHKSITALVNSVRSLVDSFNEAMTEEIKKRKE